MRTALRSNEAAQGLFKLIAAFGAGGYRAAVLLVQYDFDITRAALEMGLSDGCEECAAGRRKDVRRGCETCLARLRQRVHRMEDRAHSMLGDRAPVTRHVRARVIYGADRLRDGSTSGRGRSTGGTIYDRTPGVYGGADESGDPEEFGGPEDA